jgi:serine/threonine-protein kinase
MADSQELRTGFAPPFPSLLLKPAEPASQEIPQVAGYEILGELGRGGMGVVYLARHCALKRLVALKMILAGSHADSATRRRFRTEAEAVARLQHPNIVQIHEVGEHEGQPFFALEYLAGGSLLHQTAGQPQPQREAAQLVATLARAMHHAHQHGILHRDLKPANILLQVLTTEDTEIKANKSSPSSFSVSSVVNLLPKITDFGLAKLVDADGGLTRSEMLLGTPNYMAPEQAAGDSKNVGVPAACSGAM